MSRIWPGRLARGATAVVVVGTAAAVGVLAWLEPVPAPTLLAPNPVAVPPAPTALVCPGPVILPEGLEGIDPEFDPAPVDAVTQVRAAAVADAGATPLELRALTDAAGAPAAVADAPEGGAATVALDPGAAVVARAQPAGDEPARVAAAMLSSVERGDLRGSAGVTCQQPASDIWLVGGQTQLGTTTILTVQNPGATAAEVDVAVWGLGGPIELAGPGRYVVAPGGEMALRLDALAAEQGAIVVNVSSAGGLVTAYLQVSVLDGFTPAGMDVVAPGPGPTPHQAVAGLVVPESEVGDALAARLRLLAPGAAEDDTADDGVPAHLAIYGDQGPVELPGAEVAELRVGAVSEIDLGGLPAGAYTVVVTAEEPVVAGAVVYREGAVGDDGAMPVELAWLPAVRPAGGTVAVPDADAAVLVVAGVAAAPQGEAPPGAGPAGGTVTGQVRIFDAAGAVLDSPPLSVAVGRSTPLVLPAGAAAVDVVVTGGPEGSGLAWAVAVTVQGPDGPFVSVLAPAVQRAAVESVVVVAGQRVTLPGGR